MISASQTNECRVSQPHVPIASILIIFVSVMLIQQKAIVSVILLITAVVCSAQIHVIDGTTLTIDNGTTVSILGTNQLLDIDSNTAVINNGIIVLADSTTMMERDGFPITGLGHEETTRNFSTAISNNNVGGLGFTLNTDSILGITSIYRGHTLNTNGTNQSVLRWYNIVPSNNISINAQVTYHYDETELNSLTESMLFLFISDDGGTNWTPIYSSSLNTISNNVSVPTLDSLHLFTAFEFITDLNEHASDLKLELFPNPSSGHFYVLLNQSLKSDVAIKVVTLAGQEIWSNSYENTSGPIEINLQGVEPGSYFVVVHTDNCSVTKPIIIN